jgi:hypothetical protein
MASLDNIFTKSNLEESKKKAKMIFGRMLISLRKSNHIKLYSLLESVSDTDLTNDTLQIVLSDKTAFDMLNNANDLSVLKDSLVAIDGSLGVEVKCDGKDPFDVYKFESRLKEEFGKLLTIKK